MRVTLDTTYLLPLFGVDIALPNFREEFRRLLRAPISIDVSSVSVLEVKGKVVREIKRGRALLASRFKPGLRSLLLSGRFRVIEYGVEIDDIVDELIRAGLDDLFDCVIAATALHGSDLLVTEDEDIAAAIRRTSYRPFPTMRWGEFVTRFLKEQADE
ncbi:TPA: PIN domain-containing protein [Candidatus Bathyarchaeota archaeon]|nr:PIN domain-containing protein [Candidatus Bathyarchaeota archaeon]